jgi:chromosome partitioning protein
MIVVVGSEKGGTGKTTLATNLAIYRAQVRRDVLLVDADPQGSAIEFSRVRESEGHTPAITCVMVTGRSVSSEVRKLAPRFDDVIDVGGRDSAALRSAMLVAQVMVIPCLPGQFDVWSIEGMNTLVREAVALNEPLRAVTVLNKVDTNPRMGLADEAAEMTKDLGPIRITQKP